MLNAAIKALDLAKEVSSLTPAKAVFGSASVLLTTIRVWFSIFSDDLFQFLMLTRTPCPTNPPMLNLG